jgi:hypothetical protein
MRQTGTNSVAWQANNPYAPPQANNYYNNVPPPSITTNPLAQYQNNAARRTSTTRAVSDEVDYNGSLREPRMIQRESVDIERAIAEVLDYFDDRRALLFAADSLSILLRTKPPFQVGRREVIESIMTWARNRCAATGWPIVPILLRVLSLIKQAETAKLLKDFDPALFYTPFVKEMATYCTPAEADEFMRGAGGLE